MLNPASSRAGAVSLVPRHEPARHPVVGRTRPTHPGTRTALSEQVSSRTQQQMKPLHLCIMGHSGVGKSPLSDLFDMRGWDPYRIRDARDAHDKVKSKQEYESLRVGANRGDVCYQSQQSSLSVCTKWSTFKVRDMEQCLDNTDFDPRSDMRIEVFAPAVAVTTGRSWASRPIQGTTTQTASSRAETSARGVTCLVSRLRHSTRRPDRCSQQKDWPSRVQLG